MAGDTPWISYFPFLFYVIMGHALATVQQARRCDGPVVVTGLLLPAVQCFLSCCRLQASHSRPQGLQQHGAGERAQEGAERGRGEGEEEAGGEVCGGLLPCALSTPTDSHTLPPRGVSISALCGIV